MLDVVHWPIMMPALVKLERNEVIKPRLWYASSLSSWACRALPPYHSPKMYGEKKLDKPPIVG